MQSIEAVISLLVFLSLSAMFIAQLGQPNPPDDSLYRLQLAEDAWRVLYLQNHFHDFSNASRQALEEDMRNITEETGLCIFMDGTDITSCRGGDERHTMTASLSKTIIKDGKPKTVSFSIGN
jgi:hypothetical protein